jgi:uncharacterized cupredoxin-like copper-binding protein
MKHILLAAAFLALAAPPAIAGGNHTGGHSAQDMPIGAPGQKAKAKRTVTIVMREKDDGRMVFEPSTLQVRKGETVRLKFLNKGETDHEYVMDVEKTVLEHKEVMAKFPEMEHDDPNAIRLKPGASGEIIWTFTNSGDFTFACLIPGHYEAGMKGALKVAAN